MEGYNFWERFVVKKLFSVIFICVMIIISTQYVYADNRNIVCTQNNISYKVGDRILFGYYPQNVVEDKKLIMKLNDLAPNWEDWISYKYYSGDGSTGSMLSGDWMRYIDVFYDENKYRGVMFTQYRSSPTSSLGNVSQQKYNGYNTDTIYWFKFMPLSWTILDPNMGLVVCDHIIDAQPFSNTIYYNNSKENDFSGFNDTYYLNYANDYETSSIRSWLNLDFYNSAFTELEKNEIVTTCLDNRSYHTLNGTTGYESFDSNQTYDYIFLLSYSEVSNVHFGFDSRSHIKDFNRCASGSDYARCQGLQSGSIFDSWLLRTPGNRSQSCCFVVDEGYCSNIVVDYSHIGVRPAMKLREISSIGQHDYSKVIISPTCTSKGKIIYSCKCGDKYTIDYLEPTSHIYSSSVTTTPKCYENGERTYTCSCGDTYTEVIPKNEHNYATWQVKTKPTCTEPGVEWTYCRNCDIDIEREIPATGHTVIEYVMRATTDEHAAYGGDGAYITACDVCNEIFKQEFFARPDEYELSTKVCTYNGKVRKPSVTVKDADGKTLIEGEDYDIIYPDEMKLPGKYVVKVLFKGNYLGEKSLDFTIKPKATTGVKAKTQTTKTITLSWSKTTGATGYRVYQYSSSKGEYVLKKSLTGTSYKVTGLKEGTPYKFKIRPYTKSEDGTVIWGADSKVLTTATKTATPTIKSISNSSRKVTITWNNVSGESGYQVYYSTSKNGTYKKLGSVGADKTTYTSEKLTAGKTYYFKVRAYKKVDDKTIYGAFSDIKSIKIPLVYYVTKTGKKYHVDGCRSLSKSKIQISYNNAVARGYKPCSSCIK